MTDSGEPIRVALVITELNEGGAERCLVNLATSLDPSRFTPTVYSLQPAPGAGRTSLVDRLAAARVPTHFLEAESVWQLFGTLRKLRHLLAAQRPQVVQSFLYHANVIGCRAAPPEAAIAGGIRVADPRRARSWLERQALSRAARIVCVSQSVADFAKSAGFPAAKLTVIPNGIDPPTLADTRPADLSQWGVGSSEPVLLFVGRLDAQKGVDWLLDGFDRVFAEHPSTHLVLAGEGPQRSELTAAAGRLSCSERIHFAGWRSDIPQLMARAQVLVLPSRWEGMPNVVLEAMAAGTPVVAARADGVEELLGAGSPQIVDFGDDAAFQVAVDDLLESDQLAEQVRQANRQRVEEVYSLGKMVERYSELYQTLAEGGGQAPAGG